MLLLLRPSVTAVAEGARASGAGGALREQLGVVATDLVFPPRVSIAALLFATIISVYKPWRTTPLA
ncbi:MAG: hypothetical protein WCA46_00400, partial [Actinocatenispora sp.]